MNQQSKPFPPALQPIAESFACLWQQLLQAQTANDLLSDLLTAEQVVERLVRTLGQQALQSFVDFLVEQAIANRRACSCGQRPAIHRYDTWERKTLVGVISIRDPYMRCGKCHASSKPLQELLGTARETWSLDVQKAAVDLAADESFGSATRKLERHHPGVQMERTSAMRLTHAHGQAAREFIEDKLAQARGRLELPAGLQPDEFEPATELEVQYDAGMVPTATLTPIEPDDDGEVELTPVRKLPKRRKNCQWEEVKLGLVQKPGELSRLYVARPTEQLDAAFDDLLSLAAIQGLSDETQVRGIADGARYIRCRLEALFACHDFQFILDRPHAKEHLSSAGEALHSLGGASAQKWATVALQKLEHGAALQVVDELRVAWQVSGDTDKKRHDTLRLEANYFDRNQDAVSYADYRAQGWSTASSEVESAHRHVIQKRLKISGAWWHPAKIDNIIALRLLKSNDGWWDEYWQAQDAAWKQGAVARREHSRSTAA